MKRLLLAVGIVSCFLLGYGAMARAGVYPGRNDFNGYFSNNYRNSGWEVLNVYCSNNNGYVYNYNNGTSWCNAVPQNVNSAGALIAFIQDRLVNGAPNGSYGDPRAKTGAAFIVHTMLGTPDRQRGRPPNGAQRLRSLQRTRQDHLRSAPLRSLREKRHPVRSQERHVAAQD